MSFLDIKDPATLVKEYVTAMKTVKQRNMMKRELMLAIADGLQTLFHPIVNATKQAAAETRKELELMKKTFADIDGALLMFQQITSFVSRVLSPYLCGFRKGYNALRAFKDFRGDRAK